MNKVAGSEMMKEARIAKGRRKWIPIGTRVRERHRKDERYTAENGKQIEYFYVGGEIWLRE